jgi:UDP-N-acetyl-2-amino-2-deoxyglucuronate dehydrogenase
VALRFALIGCGRIGTRHAEDIQIAGKLAAVCDVDREKVNVLGKKYNAASFYSVEELLSAGINIDVVAVCTPNGLHTEHSIQALKAGCHVLCEKPMSLTTAGCREMMAAANEYGKQIFVVKQNRFNPPVVAVKKLLEEKRLGKIFSFQLNCFWHRGADYYDGSWRGTKELDGGILFTQFSHFIDLLYWMLGDVKQVQSFTADYAHRGIIEFEDTGVVILEFENGAIGTLNFTINSFEKNMEGSLALFGEKGTVKIGGQYLNELEYQQIENYVIPDLPAGNRANDYGFYQGSMSNHDKVYQNLADVLLRGAPVSAGSFDGLKTVEIIEKIYAAAQFLN